MRDGGARLRDISLVTDRLQKETGVGREAFHDDPKLQVRVLCHLQVIGEACRSLSESFRTRFSEIGHELVWQVVEGDRPAFRKVVEPALGEIQEGNEAGGEPPG